MKSHFETKEKRHEVGRYLAAILIKEAPSLGLEIDKYGHIYVGELLRTAKGKYSFLTQAHIEEIVEKEPQDCSPKEIAFVDLKNEDQGTLMTAILSGGEGLPLDFLQALGREIRKLQAGENEESTEGQNRDKEPA